MKRILTIVAGIAVLGGAAYVGNRLWAQGTATNTPAQPPTRIALLNMSYVTKKYKKCKTLADDFGAQQKQAEAKLLELKRNLTETTTRMNDPKTSQTEREQLNKEVKRLDREIQDKQDEIRTTLGKSAADSTVMIFKEIENMAWRTANQMGATVVLHYSDPWFAKEDRYNPRAIDYRLNPGVCMPLWATDGVDISDLVTKYLDYEYDEHIKQAGARQPKN